MEKKYSSYEIWQPFLFAGMVALGMIIGHRVSHNETSLIQPIAEVSGVGPIGRVEEIVRFIESKYVDSLNSDEILENAISNIIGDLDPHSLYLRPEQLSAINEQMEGSYRGIGVESFYLQDTVRISRVIPGGPADRAGIKPLDKLTAINDSTIAGVGLDYGVIRTMLRSENQDELKLTVVSPGDDVSKTVRLNPSNINLYSSNIFFEIEENVGYIKIDRFSSKTYKEFMEGLETLVEDEGIKHLIIDVRDNPGGYLPETVNILSQLFSEKGRLLVYTAGKEGNKTEYKTSGKNFFKIDKIAVLIDEGSASGSEIIAGALQDWDRGIVIGRRSFGKGLVQEQYKLSNGGAIRLTTARYYTPSGRSIQKPYEEGYDYDSDIDSRYKNGELFQGNYEIEDSTIFNTLVLNRPVYGGGGVYPDVYIPLDSTVSYYDLQSVQDFIPEFIFRQRENQQSLELNEDQNLSDLSIFLGGRGLKLDDLKVDVEEINNLLLAEWAYQTISPIEKERIILRRDPYIEKALDYISSDRNLNEY